MSDLNETLIDIHRLFPNFSAFIKVILKKEKLSEEAELTRARYEAIIKGMEEEHPLPRPASLIGDDDSGYHSTKPKVVSVPGIPSVSHTGFLLKRDDKYRWHRYWCRIDSKDMKFLVFSDSHEETLLKSISLSTVTTSFGIPQATECDKENGFILSCVADGGEESGGGVIEDIVLAAYSDVDYQQWRSALTILTGTRDSLRISSGSLLDGSHWGALPPRHDAASTSSSNFSSNRESVISTTSSLPYMLRLPNHESPPRGRSPLGQGSSIGDTSSLSSKQLQPLPSLPPEDGDHDREDDDNASVGTIYENIDNLVLQFDSTMQATVQAMGQVGQHLGNSKKVKKKDRSLLRQTSFFKGGKGHKARLSTAQKNELERGEYFAGHLYKRSSNGSWKKKWFVLKGAVLSYSKNMEDVEGREYVVLDAQIERTTDPKKSFAFKMNLRGLPEPLCFGTDDENVMNEWIKKLECASISKRDFSWDMWRDQQSDEQPSRYHSQTSLDSVEMSESHYNVPRSIHVAQASAASSAAQPMPAGDAVNSGIYSVPSSLLASDVSNTFTIQGQSFSLSGDPYAKYDVPRPLSLIPDEEAIYDYPENVVDMEIYDYPPDALSLLPPPPDMCPVPPESSHNSVATLTSDFSLSARSSLAAPDDWSHITLPPPPVSLSSSRPSVAISTTSSDEYFQSARNSVASVEGLYDRPRNRSSNTFNRSSMGEVLEEQFTASTTLTETPETSTSLEFGVCAIQGFLYKKERFTWNKMNCLIRNSFLECHKPNSTQGPALKLFLPRSVITPDKEAKRQWAIRVKHPRREGVLQFAAENEEGYRKWMKAFSSAAAIEVQLVNTVEEIRITDLDMHNRWTTLERNSTLQQPETTETKKKVMDDLPPMQTGRRNTYSAGDGYVSDTLKRRRKFSWIKTLSRKRRLHHAAVSDTQLASDKQHMNGAVVKQQQSEEGWSQQPTTVVVAPEDRAHRVTTDDGVEQFQGYLHVQRKGANNTWVRYWCVLEDLSISCYISRSDLALTLSIQLKGSRVADAAHDCKRQNSFKIWHLESGQCLFFAADDAIEYGSWFKEVTKGAEYVVPLDAGISNSPLAAPFYHFTKDSPADSSPSQRSSRSSIASLPELDLDTAPVNTGGTVVYKGNLKKLTQNKWKDRYCVVKDLVLQVFATSSEKTLLTTVPLAGAGVELVSVPNEEVHHFTFRVCIPSGKSHMFCAVSEQEMYAWATTLQDVAYQRSDVKEDPMAKSRKKVNSSTLKHIEKLFTPIPASSLSNPVHAGYAEVLALGSWQRYWCVVHSGALYLYQNHEYPTTTLTIVLKGYRITVGGPRGCKKPCVIAMQYPGLHTTFMSVLDQNELNVWFNALERGTRMESTIQHLRKPPEVAAMPATDVRVKVTPCEEADPPSLGTENKKTTADEQLTETPLKKEETSGPPPQHIIRKYEKKVRKTHRVANVTEQNLKRQQASLMHFKRELSQTTGKLQELANKGDEHAIKRLKSVRVKLQQIDKILPYIGKYIMVNRQAEIQTVAILKESCTVDLQRIKGDAIHAGVASQDPEPSRSPALKPLETCEEEAECTATVEPTQHSSEVMASSLISEQTTANPGITPPVPQNEAQKEVPAAEPLEPAPPTPLSSPELVEQRLSPHAPDDSPYANLKFLQSEAQKIHTKGVGRGEDPTVREESPYATLASVRPGEVASNQSHDEVQYAEIVKVMSPTIVSPSSAPKSPYAELDFTKMQQQQQQQPQQEQQQRLTPTSPRSRLNYVEVSFNAGKSKAIIADETDSKTEEIDTTLVARSEEKETNPLDETITSVEQPLTLSTSAPSPKSRAAALQEAIKLFEPPHSSTPSKPSSSKAGPPPVKRRPKQSNPSANRSSIPQESFTSPSHAVTEETGKKDTEHCSDDAKLLVSETDEAQSVATGTMSVLERIKVLQQKSN